MIAKNDLQFQLHARGQPRQQSVMNIVRAQMKGAHNRYEVGRVLWQSIVRSILEYETNGIPCTAADIAKMQFFSGWVWEIHTICVKIKYRKWPNSVNWAGHRYVNFILLRG